MTTTGTTYGPAAQIRRLAIDAAGARMSAVSGRDKASAAGRVHAYLITLGVLLDAGIADEGIAPSGSTQEDPAWLTELIRLTGAEQAGELGLTP
jgi:hypothetical protein